MRDCILHVFCYIKKKKKKRKKTIISSTKMSFFSITFPDNVVPCTVKYVMVFDVRLKDCPRPTEYSDLQAVLSHYAPIGERVLLPV